MTLPKIETDYLMNFLVELLNTPSPTGYAEPAIALVEKELANFQQLKVSHTRKGALTFPANFVLVAELNPCPCA
jgi:putative aminopeptidase FrvX